MLLLHKNIHPIQSNFFIFHQITFFIYLIFLNSSMVWPQNLHFSVLLDSFPSLLSSLLSPSHPRCGVEQRRSLSDEHNSVHDDLFTFNILCTFGKMWPENKDVIHFYFSQLTYTHILYIFVWSTTQESHMLKRLAWRTQLCILARISSRWIWGMKTSFKMEHLRRWGGTKQKTRRAPCAPLSVFLFMFG